MQVFPVEHQKFHAGMRSLDRLKNQYKSVFSLFFKFQRLDERMPQANLIRYRIFLKHLPDFVRGLGHFRDEWYKRAYVRVFSEIRDQGFSIDHKLMNEILMFPISKTVPLSVA